MRVSEITLAAADPAGQAALWGGRLGLQVRETAAVEVVLRRSTIRFEPANDGTEPRYHLALFPKPARRRLRVSRRAPRLPRKPRLRLTMGGGPGSGPRPG